MSIEEKLQQLAALAEQLEEAKKSDNEDMEVGQDEDQDAKEDGTEDKSDDQDDSDEKEDDKEKNEAVEVAPIDLGPLFEGQEFSEEFKTKATAVFEAAVDARVAQKAAELQESMETELSEQTESISESLVEKVDGYLDYMVEQWMKNNALAIDRGIKVEIMESFMSQLKGVFESHYIDVPDEKYDLVEAAQQEAEELAEKLDSVIEENVELRSVLKDTVRVMQIEEVAKGLALTDAEKFKELAESLSYTDSEEFETKLEGLRENYFTKKPAQKTELTEEFMSDAAPVNTQEEINEQVDSTMSSYLKAIRK
jgi:hypothetical protein